MNRLSGSIMNLLQLLLMVVNQGKMHFVLTLWFHLGLLSFQIIRVQVMTVVTFAQQQI